MLFADAQILLLPWVSLHQFFEQMWQIFTGFFFPFFFCNTYRLLLHLSTVAVPSYSDGIR